MRRRSTIGPRLRARHVEDQALDSRVACEVLNRTTSLGMPHFIAILAA